MSADDPTRAAAELCRRYAADPEQSSTHLLANGGHCTVGLMVALLERGLAMERALLQCADKDCSMTAGKPCSAWTADQSRWCAACAADAALANLVVRGLL